LDEAEWARRADERARQQQEQFRREKERIESETQAKGAKVLSRDELIRLYENNENKWRLLKEVLLKEAEVRHKQEEVTRKEGGTRRKEVREGRRKECVFPKRGHSSLLKLLSAFNRACARWKLKPRKAKQRSKALKSSYERRRDSSKSAKSRSRRRSRQ
jgi:hypothetical protein